MFGQMYSYFDKMLSEHQRGFFHGHITQHSVFLMVEKLKKSLGNSDVGGICKIAKLAAYGFNQPSLSFIYSYLSERTENQSKKMLMIHMLILNMVFHKAYIIYPILFNIDICNFFLLYYKCDIVSYADGNIQNTSGINLGLRKLDQVQLMISLDGIKKTT